MYTHFALVPVGVSSYMKYYNIQCRLFRIFSSLIVITASILKFMGRIDQGRSNVIAYVLKTALTNSPKDLKDL